MAGQYKQGIDFWPRSVQLIRDPKLRVPKMKYGYLAVIVYELLLDMMFADKGYYIDYSRKPDVIWTVLEGLMGKHQPAYETIAECIEDLTACELFSGDLFKREIITSRRAQETYYRATVERKMANIDWSIWMLTEAEMTAVSDRSVILVQFRDVRPNDSVNRPNDSQSKVKQSKVKQSKKEIGADKPPTPAKSVKMFVPPTLEEVTEYCSRRGNSINPQRFLDYFEASGWVDSKGNKVKNWKQKIITWESRELNVAFTAQTQASTGNPFFDMLRKEVNADDEGANHDVVRDY